MSKDADSSSKTGLHPVFTVSNIQHKVRVLDGTKVTYASWVRLFKLHTKGHDVSSHIDGTPAPAKTDDSYASWCKIDAHVLQWIYCTMSDELLPRILEDESTAREAWLRVENIFNNNKGARAASLESEFNSLKLASMPSLEAYCQRLRELAGMLNDVDAKVSDTRLVIQLVRGLTKEYQTVASYINQTSPDFETARSMLELELHRQNSTDESATALAAPPAAPVPTPERETWSPPPTRPQPAGNPRQSTNRFPRRNNNGNNYRGHNHSNRPPYSNHWGPPPSWSPSWTPPPCPYPTYPGWVQPWQPPVYNPRPPSRPGQQQRPHGQAHILESESPQLTDLSQSFQALSVQSPGSDAWYMDTGASSHLTSNPGYPDWDYDYEE